LLIDDLWKQNPTMSSTAGLHSAIIASGQLSDMTCEDAIAANKAAAAAHLRAVVQGLADFARTNGISVEGAVRRRYQERCLEHPVVSSPRTSVVAETARCAVPDGAPQSLPAPIFQTAHHDEDSAPLSMSNSNAMGTSDEAQGVSAASATSTTSRPTPRASLVATVALQQHQGLYLLMLAKQEEPVRQAKIDAIVISGPSGVGKGTIIGRLMEDRPETYAFCVSHTSRKPRDGEVDGVNYHFSTFDQMAAMHAEGKFLEMCTVHGNSYGTSKAALEAVGLSGKVPIVEIDVQGAQKMKTQQGSLNIFYMFIAAPSMAELKARLTGRGTDTQEKAKVRLETAEAEMKFMEANKGFFDTVFVNDDLERTLLTINRTFKLYCGM
jgi:guanylate kinase